MRGFRRKDEAAAFLDSFHHRGCAQKRAVIGQRHRLNDAVKEARSLSSSNREKIEFEIT
jgi:hypothetical protein